MGGENFPARQMMSGNRDVPFLSKNVGLMGPERELQSLIRKIDREILMDCDEMILEMPAYDRLVECVRGTELTRNQVATLFSFL
jgi:hypothetical protein